MIRVVRMGFVFCILCATSTAQELTWAETKKEIQAEPFISTVLVEFPYKNNTPRPIEIEKVTTSCGCVAAKFEGQTIKSGESGTLKAKVDFKGKTGLQKESVLIREKGKESKPYQLDIHVQVYPPVQAAPSFLFWKKGETTEKKVDIVPHPSLAIEEMGIMEKAQHFNARLEKWKNGYYLKITPGENAGSAILKESIKLNWRTNGKDQNPLVVYLLIK